MGIINGVGVVVVDSGRVLLGLRNSGAWSGYWSLPGGKLDPLESVDDGARRELLEETGLRAEGDVELFSVSAEIDVQREFHCITFGAKVHSVAGPVVNTEPHKFAEWRWFPLSELPEPMFRPTESVLKAYCDRSGVTLPGLEAREFRAGEFCFPITDNRGE